MKKLKKYVTQGTSWKVDAKITERLIDRETEASIWVNGNRRNKVSEYETYHDSWDAAHAHLLEAAERKVEGARRNLEAHTNSLDKVKSMERPLDSEA